VFENRVLRKIFGARKRRRIEEITYEELHNFRCSPNILVIRVSKSKEDKMGRKCKRLGEMRNAYKGRRLLEA
jgi:hypothetical protein